MSEFLAEAQVSIRPDTTRFRAELITDITAITRALPPFPISVAPVVSTTGTAIAATVATTAALQRQAAAAQAAGAASSKAAVATTAHSKAMQDAGRAAAATTATMAGLRGAAIGASGPFLAAAVAITAFSKGVRAAANLESDLNVFRVTAAATAEEMERVSAEAKALGRDLSLPGVTATDAAQTFLALSRAGLTVKDSLEGARGVLQLAVAAQISFADSAQITASALNAFALDGAKAVSVADLLTNAANASQASIADMGIALRQSAAIADLAGFSISETVTFLTQLARAGLAGSDAGTSFRVSIQRLIAPTDAAREKLEGLKINLRDAQENLRPEAFFELGQALERMGRAQADAARQTIFGNDASRAAAFFARINAESFREQERSLNRQGAAAEIAGARNEGFAGSLENVKNQATALGTEIGDLSLPVLGVAADTVALIFGSLADQIARTRDVFRDFGEDIKGTAGALRDLSDESGFTQFVDDVGHGATVVEREYSRASDAFGDFARAVVGVELPVEEATTSTIKLTAEERRLAEAIHDSIHPIVQQTTTTDALAAAMERAAAAVARLQGQQRGLEEQVTRARIAGDEGAEIARLRELRATLEVELRQQEAIIARPGEQGEATARQAIRTRILPQLEAVNNEIENIIQGQKTENERLAEDAARAASERDRNLLDALSGRRGDAERAISIAGDTEGVRDDIRAQNVLQALIKQQIQKIRDQVRDEGARRAAIRELRIAANASRREEARLREEQREAAEEQRVTAIEQRARGLELDIDLADITENDARRVALRRRRIAQLRREVKLLKLEGNALKENRNERARIRREIEEILKEDKETTGKGFPQVAFEFLQQQQGFAANLFGNLIPSSATGGLVGGSQPLPGPPIQIAQAQARADSVSGPTRGQVATEVSVLQEMLQVLKAIQRGSSHPEATRQRKTQAGSMDTLAL